ncbi:MAG: (d)CMP kinase [Alphaproteobacteria bacterium]|nr:(d)CMP kinase [Alphaproteobacteria bacterium]
MIIAIDGPAAVGTGTLARGLAARFNLGHLDSGLLYRAVAARVLAGGGGGHDPDQAAGAARAVAMTELAEPALRREDVGRVASMVAVHPAVRQVLLGRQRDFARRPPAGTDGAVLDGRDIGTVVLPDADVKFFLTGSLDVRLVRRVKELRARGEPFIQARVEQDMRERDQRDRSRAAAPLAAATDAHVIDTTEIDAEAVLETACRLVRSSPRISRTKVRRKSGAPSDTAQKVRSQESP